MSRGHGTYQRRVVARLSADEKTIKEGLSMRALQPALGPDRSNRRRVIRSLIRRGDAEVVSDPETGERRLKLPFLPAASALMRLRDTEGYDEALDTPCTPGYPMYAENVREEGFK